MAYEMVMPYHLHMPSYFLETFTEYPFVIPNKLKNLFTSTLCLQILRKIQNDKTK